MSTPQRLPKPGTVLRLLRELDHMQPGEFVLLHFERSSAVLYPLESPDDMLELCASGDDDDGPYLRVTKIDNLSSFEHTGASMPVDSWQGSLARPHD